MIAADRSFVLGYGEFQDQGRADILNRGISRRDKGYLCGFVGMALVKLVSQSLVAAEGHHLWLVELVLISARNARVRRQVNRAESRRRDATTISSDLSRAKLCGA